MTSAYGVFANDGVRNPYRSVLEVDDSQGNVLEKATTDPTQVIPAVNARQISDILSDNSVRMASLIPIGNSVGRTVAIKTGTTNDYRDVWTIGYTPNLVVGAWAGNNDNTPMQQKISPSSSLRSGAPSYPRSPRISRLPSSKLRPAASHRQQAGPARHLARRRILLEGQHLRQGRHTIYPARDAPRGRLQQCPLDPLLGRQK